MNWFLVGLKRNEAQVNKFINFHMNELPAVLLRECLAFLPCVELLTRGSSIDQHIRDMVLTDKILWKSTCCTFSTNKKYQISSFLQKHPFEAELLDNVVIMPTHHKRPQNKKQFCLYFIYDDYKDVCLYTLVRGTKMRIVREIFIGHAKQRRQHLIHDCSIAHLPKDISEGILPGLHTLNLSHLNLNLISDDIMTSIFRSISECGIKLKHLDLSFNYLNKQIIDPLKQIDDSQLEYVDLHGDVTRAETRGLLCGETLAPRLKQALRAACHQHHNQLCYLEQESKSNGLVEICALCKQSSRDVICYRCRDFRICHLCFVSDMKCGRCPNCHWNFCPECIGKSCGECGTQYECTKCTDEGDHCRCCGQHLCVRCSLMRNLSLDRKHCICSKCDGLECDAL